MRFKEIQTFNVDDLLLDEGNYRFKKADDQKECIAKIYHANPTYFKGLMRSIAEDDLGEPLLVYENNKENIVLDGNRRLAALKVLSSDDYLPVKGLKEYADKLRENNALDFADIQAQVSSNKKLVMRTVYERHAGQKTGKSRIQWTAYPAARFGYDQEIGDNNEWHFVSLLMKTEEEHPEITEYIDKNKFYETFRRLMREAFKRELISKEIFSARNKRIKSTANKKLIKDAIAKTLKILDSMKKREISLSRSESYANKETVEKFFDSFSLSPDAQQAANAKDAASKNQDPKNDSEEHSQKDDNPDNLQNNQSDAESSNDDTEAYKNNEKNRPNNLGIIKSNSLASKLDELQSPKLSGLYKSLCNVSLNTNPQLMYVGAWSFLECMCDHMGKTEKTSFKSFLDGKMNSWNYPRKKKNDLGLSLDDIMKKGNANKHSSTYASTDALQLRVDFQVLDELLIQCLDELIDRNKKAA